MDSVGIDIHIHDYYLAVGNIPTLLAAVVVAVAILFGAWKLAKFLWLMVTG